MEWRLEWLVPEFDWPDVDKGLSWSPCECRTGEDVFMWGRLLKLLCAPEYEDEKFELVEGCETGVVCT